MSLREQFIEISKQLVQLIFLLSRTMKQTVDSVL